MSLSIDKNALLREVEKAGKITLGFTDIDGVLRGKTINFPKFAKSLESEVGFCTVVFGWDMHDSLYPSGLLSGWDEGYPDGNLTLDASTFRRIPWANDTPFLLGDFNNDKLLSYICPRSLLHRIFKKAEDIGYRVLASAEYEWFNFKIESDKDVSQYSPVTESMFGYSLGRIHDNQEYVDDLWSHLANFHIPLEGLHTETGPGVYEAAIQYDTLIQSADRGALFKYAAKSIGKKHNILPSFMAKYKRELPGCGGHIHQSLANDRGVNLFYKEGDNEMTDVMKSYLAGILHCAPYILPMYAPTINSYKRLTGDWAATSVSWGYDNRTTAVRAICTGPQSARIETRLPGADANPYLAMAATVASGIYGIENNLSLEQEAVSGSAYDKTDLPALATSLKEATMAMEDSEIAISLFGKEFISHFLGTRKAECSRFEKTVTDWEIKRYREII